jgi:hypothetical protein
VDDVWRGLAQGFGETGASFMTVRIAVVCEARADRQTGCGLADRVICEQVDWIETGLLEHVRQWCGVHEQVEFVTWRDIKTLAIELGIFPQGHFGGKPGMDDSYATTRALFVIEKLANPDAVILLRDDDRITNRRQGLEQGRERVNPLFPVIIGLAHTKRECWVLAGFKPVTDDEGERLQGERKKLGFDPTCQPEKLTARRENSKRCAKRVLRKLADDDWDRQQSCWEETELEILRNNGEKTGLTEYLEEVRTHLVPLFTKPSQ